MPLDPATKAVIDMMTQYFPPTIAGLSADEFRALLAERRVEQPPGDEVGAVEDRTIDGPLGPIPIRIYRPAGDAGPHPGVVFFHGGGFVIGDLESHDAFARRICTAVDAVVVSVDYRLAPEDPYPACAEDSYAATRWTAEHADELGIDPTRLAVAGDSAGGNLSAVVALMARDRGGPSLAYQVMIYPVIDLTDARHSYASQRDNAAGYMLTTEHMEWFRRQYVSDDAQAAEAYCSPIMAELLAGLPPACVVTAEFDPLRDEGEAYARALAAAGVPVTAYRADGMFHGFFSMDLVLEGAKKAQDVAFTAMRTALETA